MNLGYMNRIRCVRDGHLALSKAQGSVLGLQIMEKLMFEPITLRNKLGMKMTINNPALMKPELIKAFMDGENVADPPPSR